MELSVSRPELETGVTENCGAEGTGTYMEASFELSVPSQFYADHFVEKQTNEVKRL